MIRRNKSTRVEDCVSTECSVHQVSDNMSMPKVSRLLIVFSSGLFFYSRKDRYMRGRAFLPPPCAIQFYVNSNNTDSGVVRANVAYAVGTYQP